MRFSPASLRHFQQYDTQDCGPTCLLTAATALGLQVDRTRLIELCRQARDGSSLAAISDAALALGLEAVALRLPVEVDLRQVPTPFIAHWNQNHFVTVLRVSNRRIWISDPAAPQVLTLDHEAFRHGLFGVTPVADSGAGAVLLLERGASIALPTFDATSVGTTAAPVTAIGAALRGQRSSLFHLTVISLCGMILAAAAPLTMQVLIDGGLGRGDIPLIAAIIGVYLALACAIQVADGLKRWAMFHISSRLHLELITGFLSHLLALPLRFFERRTTGDLLSRIEDHRRVENFASTQVVETIISCSLLLTYTAVLFYYNSPMGLIFLSGILLYIGWIFAFLSKRRVLDYLKFQEDARSRGREIRILDSILDIKVSASEAPRAREWEATQFKLYQVNTHVTRLEQAQAIGGRVILEVTLAALVLIGCLSFLAGGLSLGAILAVVMILGQSLGPATRLISFIQGYQDLTLSLERISAVAGEPPDEQELAEPDPEPVSEIRFSGVRYNYDLGASNFALDDINFVLEPGKTLAVVGESGSGKSTLIKLLLKLYAPTAGSIQIGDAPLSRISGQAWRRQCGVVLQEGGLFDGTIEANITEGGPFAEREMLIAAARLASIHGFIQSLPQGYRTVVGKDGLAVSTGQRQRILLARAFYKRPRLLILDEATSALDAENEAQIAENLRHRLPGTTQFIVAHRLSTVRNADEILVLSEGRIVERGRHDDLVRVQGPYYHLIASQLQREPS